jgi:hypothetical protein
MPDLATLLQGSCPAGTLDCPARLRLGQKPSVSRRCGLTAARQSFRFVAHGGIRPGNPRNRMRSWPSCHEGPKASANHSKLLSASTATLTDLGLVQAPTRTPANGRMWKYTLPLPQSRSCWPAPGVVLQHWSSHGHGSVGAAATLSPCLQATVRIRQSVATRALWVKTPSVSAGADCWPCRRIEWLVAERRLPVAAISRARDP